jgi:hypothetical protein
MPVLTQLATLTVGLLATGTAAVGVHAASDHAQDSAEPGTVRVPCGAVWDRLPAELRTDLQSLRDLSPAERAREVPKIRRHALAGDYGDRVQSFAEHRDRRRAWIWMRLPADLRHDLREVRRATPAERADLVAEVRDHALAGDYGDRVQLGAERIQDRRDTCRPSSAG